MPVPEGEHGVPIWLSSPEAPCYEWTGSTLHRAEIAGAGTLGASSAAADSQAWGAENSTSRVHALWPSKGSTPTSLQDSAE